MKFSVTILALVALASPSQAFVTPTSSRQCHGPVSTFLKDIVTDENIEAVDSESNNNNGDAVVPTSVPLPVDASSSSNWHSKINKNISPDRIEKAMKTRPYPLFIAEKAASLLDFTSSSKEPYDVNKQSNTKEKIVILGTGWGAAAFLKDIDTDKYDVTVISPRNYFVFTPMLAGASVGTVEYRSITRPIREVGIVE